ncbi:aldehyde ferredoxin oxidoreductase family protein [Miniphocaeibacter halophilus]|uniref:Aldehyde ferredoxin oxidoreductase family protein n=1 Tax=Miniphocaeibacter halophilus TaxID=2931922 RepID=A0AC61MMA4_9FIRM|nr:aldehyde ferredoxin oxidoreductase family protein [Miniphocaeibacter halophilus]QQK06865.1 aldehyde ferredoxin oxidoreductase family protein [Miniphocaeibacter halophilus]
MTTGGFRGKILRIDLTNKEFYEETPPLEFYKDYVGGALLSAKIMYDETDPKMDPLSEDNKIIYSAGPLTGTDTPCASRLCMVTKSPLTNTITTSLSGGYFPVELKRAGYDAIVISGKAEKPTFVFIKDGTVKFRDATRYWGLNVFDTQMYMKEQLRDQNIRISCIGPAAEKLSTMGCVINEARAAGRKGIGAVLGSKNLKAVAIRGTDEIPVADKARSKKSISQMLKYFKASPMAYPQFGTKGSSVAFEVTSNLGVLPSYNWLNSEDIDWDEVMGPEVLNEYNITRNPCDRCPIACSQVRLIRKGKYSGISSEGPEYESMFSLGTLLGIKSAEFTIVADRLTDELGIDNISVGAAIAFAMELYEKGIITKEDTGGLELNFGNEDAALTLMKQIAFREGFGAVLTDGTKKAAEIIGKGSEAYTLEVKGLELPAYDARGLKAQALNFATSFTGADHNKGYAFQEVFGTPYPHAVDRLALEGKGKLTKFNQDFASLYDIVTFCEFPAQAALVENFQALTAELLSGIMGFEYTEDDAWQMGEKLINLCRMYNIRNGFTRKDDSLPTRVKNEPIPSGLSKGAVTTQEELDFMLDEYYEARGWDQEGMPTPEKLEELGLEFAIKDLP